MEEKSSEKMNWERVVEINSWKSKDNRKIDFRRGWIGFWSLGLISNGQKSCKEQGWGGGKLGEKTSIEAEGKGRGKEGSFRLPSHGGLPRRNIKRRENGENGRRSFPF
jgi:hypothetical protein